MFKCFQIFVGITFCCLILFSQAYAKIATPISGGIQIPIDACTQVSLIARKKVTANLEGTLSSLGYNSYLLRAALVNHTTASFMGLNAADVWSKTPYSKQANWSYSERSPQLNPRLLNYRKYYDIITPNIGGNIGVIIEFFSNPMTMMMNDYYNAVDKQAWTDNIASQLQGVTTSVDANGDGIIVEQGTCPSISITLDKPTVTACESETGSLTINDPSGQNGTVALTLPDASTQSFTYTGGVPAPIPFSYAVSEPAGSTLNFSATATSNSGKTSNQPATATAHVIVGGLNVTIKPAKTVVEPTLNNLRKWMQKAGANKTLVTINVTDPNNQPVTNAQFTVLGVETVPGAETYGGHDHAADANNALTKPTGTWWAIKNLGSGQYSSIYTASMFASQEQLYAIVSSNGCEGFATSPPIEAKIQGLVPIVLPLGGIIHSFIGGTCHHYGAATPWNLGKLAGCNGTTGTSNRYLTTFRENLLHKLLFAYAKEWNTGLYINDASLKFGGAFDVNGDWAYKPHSNHRLGLDVDIALKENKPPLNTNPTNLNGKTLKRKLNSIILSDPMLRGNWVARLHKNHIHLKPNLDNWRGK